MDKRNVYFENPPAAYRGKPFWSWNGELKEEELLRQIENFKRMGMGGYFCHSRVGLVTEYLGEDWFRLINACADKGEEIGLESWLYDEDRWPSGTAGGAVTENPAYRLKFIRLEILPGEGFVWDGEGVACFTADVDGFSFSGKRRLEPGGAAEGRTVLLFTIEEMEKESMYNGYTYVDTMNPEAVQDFIDRTHERYGEHCGGRLGTKIRGMFTDEPHRGQVMCGFGIRNRDKYYLTPWTPSLFSDFQEMFGGDLIERLPELFLWKDGEKVHPVKWQYMELLQQKFQNVFLTMNRDWCREHGMKLTGHLLHEDTLTAQAAMLGSLIRAYEYMDEPGVDVLGRHNRIYWIVKQAASAARQLGKPKILSEMYADSGWGYRFENFKALGDWQALFGINQRCHHLSWYSMKGSAKRDYPASISGQSAWYPYFDKVEGYFARLHVFMEPGEPVCDILIVNPVESAWVNIYPGWSSGLGTESPDVQRIERIYFDTFFLLCGAKLDFDYGDEDFLARLAAVEEDESGVYLRVGKARYRSVLVTGMITMRSTTLQLLREFAGRGGRVVFAGDLPGYVDALPSQETAGLPARYIPWEPDAILRELAVRPVVTVLDAFGRPVTSIYAQARRSGADTSIFLLNMDWEKRFENCTVKLDMGGFCEKWDPRTGQVSLLASGDVLEFPYDFHPDEELLLRVTPCDNGYARKPEPGRVLDRQTVNGTFAYTLSEPNVCPLHFVRYRTDGGDWSVLTDILEADTAIRRGFGLEERSGEALQPWFAAKLEQPVICTVELEYAFRIEVMPTTLRLAVEAPEDFDIAVNGRQALRKTEAFWADIAFTVFEVDIAALQAGTNTIRLTTRFREKVNLEALYLLGDFGVSVQGREASLTRLPERLQTGDIAEQGLPFYGAPLTYAVPVPAYGQGQRLILSAASMGGAACIRAIGNGEAFLWAPPFEVDITDLAVPGGQLDIQYVLTRNNTFEPLHPAPRYTGEYDLLAQGMPGDLQFTVYDHV